MIHHRYFRAVILLLIDSATVAGALLLSYWLRFDALEAGSGADYQETLPAVILWFVGVRAVCGILSRQYIWSFFHASLTEAVGLIASYFAGTAILFVLFHVGSVAPTSPPRSIFALELATTLMGAGFVRFLPRYVHQQYLRRFTHRSSGENRRLRTLIFGAGGVGELLVRDISRIRAYPYDIIGFIDDNPAKSGAAIHGVRVLGTSADLPAIIADRAIDKLLIAVPDLPAPKLRAIIDLCGHHHLRFKIVPSFRGVVANGQTAPVTLKDIQPEDLLERAPVEFDHGRMASMLVDRTALVTGAAGSIGSEICRQLSRNGIRRIVALDLNESGLYFLRLELGDIAPKCEVQLEVGSIRDMDRMRAVFEKHRPQLVFHAAAHKHVPLMEDCPAEALLNNVLGTWNIAMCAKACRTERFVLISSDKAVRSTNVMGATKRLAEFVARHVGNGSRTRFTTVRFGNVLGSSGSLLPILEHQIAKGGPVTITHPDITRYFMTIPEAVGLVLIAMMHEEGQLCVLDMGMPINIDKLTRQLISLHGLVPEQDIKIEYTGLRPGEKMYEELFGHAESLAASSHPKIFIATSSDDHRDVGTAIRELEDFTTAADDVAVKAFLQKYVQDYRPDPFPQAPRRQGPPEHRQKEKQPA